MKRVFIITIIMLAFIWALGAYEINSSQNQYIVPKLQEEPKSVVNTKISSSTEPVLPTKKVAKKIATSTPVVKTPEIVAIPKAPEPIPDFEIINTNARKSLVNIFCTVKGNELSPISGTGVVIDPKGIVLTNAHVGQYFLLKDLYVKNYIECVLRTGSPAYPRYKVELVYISPQWVRDNKTLLKSQNPQGTGENDFALLRITGVIDGSTLPLNIPYLLPNTREILILNEPVILVSYPAGFLGGLSIIRDLNVTSGITAIRDLFTFTENKIDIISVPGTVVSQKGSSGGAVVDKNESLIGIITTSSSGNTTEERNLNALTLAYINRNLKANINLTLSEFLSEDVEKFAKNFQENEAVGLTKIITDELTRNQ